MTRLRIAFFNLIASLLLSACSTQPYTDYDTAYPFAQASSFYLATAESDHDPLMAARVQAAVEGALTAQGLRAASSRQQADLAVRYALTTEDRPNNNRVSIGMGTGSYGRSGGVSVGGSVSRPVGGDTKRYLTVQIDMHPGTEDRLVWRGRDSMELRGDPARRAEDAQRLVQRLLAAFPPQASAGNNR